MTISSSITSYLAWLKDPSKEPSTTLPPLTIEGVECVYQTMLRTLDRHPVVHRIDRWSLAFFNLETCNDLDACDELFIENHAHFLQKIASIKIIINKSQNRTVSLLIVKILLQTRPIISDDPLILLAKKNFFMLRLEDKIFLRNHYPLLLAHLHFDQAEVEHLNGFMRGSLDPNYDVKPIDLLIVSKFCPYLFIHAVNAYMESNHEDLEELSVEHATQLYQQTKLFLDLDIEEGKYAYLLIQHLLKQAGKIEADYSLNDLIDRLMGLNDPKKYLDKLFSSTIKQVITLAKWGFQTSLIWDEKWLPYLSTMAIMVVQSYSRKEKTVLLDDFQDFYKAFNKLNFKEKTFYLKECVFKKEFFYYLLENNLDGLISLLTLYLLESKEETLSDWALENIHALCFNYEGEEPALVLAFLEHFKTNLYQNLCNDFNNSNVSSWSSFDFKMRLHIQSLLEINEQLIFLNLHGTEDSQRLYQYIQENNIQCKASQFSELLTLLEHVNQLSSTELVHKVRLVNDLNEIIGSISSFTQIKTMLITYGRPFLLQLYQENLISFSTIFLYASALQPKEFSELVTDNIHTLNNLSLLSFEFTFDEEHQSLAEHLATLFLSEDEDENYFIDLFFEEIQETLLGDGLFCLFMEEILYKTSYFPKVIPYLNLWVLGHLIERLPNSDLAVFKDRNIEDKLFMLLPKIHSSKCQYLVEYLTNWLGSITFDHHALMNLSLVDSRSENFDFLFDHLDQIKNSLLSAILSISDKLRHLSVIKNRADKLTIYEQFKSVEASLLKYQNPFQICLNLMPSPDELLCPLSSELMQCPIKLTGDISDTIFEKRSLLKWFEEKKDESHLAPWPHDPSKKFNEQHFITIDDEDRKRLESIKHTFVEETRQFIERTFEPLIQTLKLNL